VTVAAPRPPRASATLAAVAELRLLLFWHRLRGRRGLAEGIAQALGFAVAAAGGLAAAAAIAAGSYRAALAGVGLQAAATLGGIFFGLWVVWTALSLSVNERDVLDLRRLLVYPVPPGRLYLTAVVAAMAADPLALTMGLALAGAFGGAAWARPGAWLLALAAVLALFAAATVALVTLLQEVLARFARSRWFRELAIVAGVLGWVGLAALGSAGHRTPWALVQLFRAGRWVFFPPAFASEAARRLYAGDGAAALPWALALAASVAATVTAAYRVALATARSGGEGSGGAPAPGRTPAAWPERIGPLLEKEARYVARHPLARISFLVVPALAAFVAWRAGPRLAAQPNEIVRALPLFALAAYAHLALQVFWLNAFGWDRGGARTLFLAPVSPERVLAAKNAAVAVLSAGVFATSALAWCAVAGAPALWAVAGACALHLGMGPIFFAVGNVVSIANPKAAAFGVQRRGGLPQLSALAGMGLFSGVAFVFACPVFLALWLDAGWVASAIWALLAAAAWTGWRATLPLTGRYLLRRRDALLAEVCGDDEG
jgi:ABC-2 type transport system permease protein